MSAISSLQPAMMPDPPTSPSISFPAWGDRRDVFRGVDWHTYSQLSQSLGEGQHIRLLYDGKDLEIMVTGNIHEILKELIGKILTAAAMGLDIDFVACGQATWKSATRGLEADLSYYFEPEKIRAAREAAGRKSEDPADYPRPDMAVEIDISPPQVDRPSIYRDLRVAEVWRFVKGETLVIEQLQTDGSYAVVERSRFIPVPADDVLRWLSDGIAEPQPAWNRRLNQWAMGLGGRP
ncbi:MAG: Uma2 family endonuclease [Isosphaeraceae bacterium]